MRIGINPARDQLLSASDFIHQVIVPVFIPNQEAYYNESLNVLKTCLESLFNTCHSKTYFTIVNNGSCKEVAAYLDDLMNNKQIHELIHTTSIGKMNAILKALVGNSFDLITITDADVLYLHGWQNKVYNIFNAFPKAGVVGTTPFSNMLKYYTATIYIDFLFSNKMRFENVADKSALDNFAKSVNNPNLFNELQLKKNLIIEHNGVKAVVGSGHYSATYRGDFFDQLNATYSSYSLGGRSELDFLDSPCDMKGYYRLSTTDNFTYHMGNTMTDAIKMIVNTSKVDYREIDFFVCLNKNKKYFYPYWIKKILEKILYSTVFWNIFLKSKGLYK
jgi:hypothetical protein